MNHAGYCLDSPVVVAVECWNTISSHFFLLFFSDEQTSSFFRLWNISVQKYEAALILVAKWSILILFSITNNFWSQTELKKEMIKNYISCHLQQHLYWETVRSHVTPVPPALLIINTCTRTCLQASFGTSPATIIDRKGAWQEVEVKRSWRMREERILLGRGWGQHGDLVAIPRGVCEKDKERMNMIRRDKAR